RKDGELLTVLRPQHRTYRVQQNPMTEAAIDARLARDVFVALADPLGDGAWGVRIRVKPLLRFVWLGALIMALGGIVAASDRRYRVPVKRDAAVPAGAAPDGVSAAGSGSAATAYSHAAAPSKPVEVS